LHGLAQLANFSSYMPNSASLTREDVLLLLVDGAEGKYPTDPVRLMKGAFLVVRRGRNEWKHLFDFREYDYGPFDPQVYDTKDHLVIRGLLDVRRGRYEQYELTDRGAEEAESACERLGDDAEWIRRIGNYASTRSFNQLLDDIYTEYPEFRERSIHRP
jgi:hypothetical protein